MSDEAKTIEELAVELREAREAYDRTHRCYEVARSAETSALNTLNAAQKAFDAGVERVREGAPWNSDWHSQRQASRRTVPASTT